MRLIDADALHDITKLYCENCEKRKGIKNGKLKFVYKIGDAPCKACQLYDMKDAIENAPTVDAEPIRHGKWLTKEYMYGLEDHEDEWVERLAEYGDCAYCSMCGGYAGLDSEEEYALTLYCPNCGAKMDEVRGEEDDC